MKKFEHAPEPVPTLKGKAARMFLKRLEEGPTMRQRQIFVEADGVYRQIKRRKEENNQK